MSGSNDWLINLLSQVFSNSLFSTNLKVVLIELSANRLFEIILMIGCSLVTSGPRLGEIHRAEHLCAYLLLHVKRLLSANTTTKRNSRRIDATLASFSNKYLILNKRFFKCLLWKANNHLSSFITMFQLDLIIVMTQSRNFFTVKIYFCLFYITRFINVIKYTYIKFTVSAIF